jgi:hypothetical protein
MKTLKIMSITGLVVAGLALICLMVFDNYTDYVSAIGWGVIATLYLIALSVVTLVQSLKALKNEVKQ